MPYRSALFPTVLILAPVDRLVLSGHLNVMIKKFVERNNFFLTEKAGNVTFQMTKKWTLGTNGLIDIFAAV